HLELPTREEGCLLTQTVAESGCNPLKLWHDLGEPSSLTAQELELLRTAARPYVESRRIAPAEGRAKLTFPVHENGVVYFSWIPGKVRPDRGYSYERVMQYCDTSKAEI
ncbi:MAG: xylan 1,4-beta-xylosidase, partial [Acetatifactor sp.]|nr:xylan 1,4-beta-xylosidase [Acetatifactor sp.]